MWEKIKGILIVIGTAITAVFAFLVGRGTNRRGLSDCDEQLDSSGDRLKSDAERVRECKEILERAKRKSDSNSD